MKKMIRILFLAIFFIRITFNKKLYKGQKNIYMYVIYSELLYRHLYDIKCTFRGTYNLRYGVNAIIRFLRESTLNNCTLASR